MFPVTTAQIRNAEKSAAAADGGEYSLMRRAGIGAADLLARWYPDRRIVFLCGGGNNGGDGLVAAGELFSRGWRVQIYSLKAKSEFCGCAAEAAADLPAGIPFAKISSLPHSALRPGDVAVDALLGIGFKGGALRPEVAGIIDQVNLARIPVTAFDLPSGVAADSGEISPDGAIRAEVTITFGGVKTGLLQGEGALCRGALRVVDIGLNEPEKIGKMEVFTNIDAHQLIPRPALDCHKNSRGRVAVWGGSDRYPGAVQLAAAGALSGGAGIVRMISGCRFGAALPYLALIPVPEAERHRAMSDSDVLLAGCGWGDAEKIFLSEAMDFPGSLVLDADALNLAAKFPELWRLREQLIITPHPGEASRLMRAFKINADDRQSCALQLAARLRATVVLKGRDTLAASPDGRLMMIAAGSPNLATAGSGDVLAGVIAALCSSGLSGFEAASLGAYIHGVAGEFCSRVICADDLPGLISSRFAGFQQNLLQ